MGDDNKLDTVMSKLDGLLESIRATKVDPGSGTTIPKERFDQVNARMQAAEQGLKAMKAEITTLGTSHAAELKQVREAAAEGLTKLSARHKDDLTLVQHGFDDDGRAALRTTWDRLDETARGESMGEWWGKQLEAVKAHREDPEANKAPELPRTLTAYLPQDEGRSGGQGGSRQRAAPAAGVVVGRRLGVDQGVVVGQKTSTASKVSGAQSWGDLEQGLAGG